MSLQALDGEERIYLKDMYKLEALQPGSSRFLTSVEGCFCPHSPRWLTTTSHPVGKERRDRKGVFLFFKHSVESLHPPVLFISHWLAIGRPPDLAAKKTGKYWSFLGGQITVSGTVFYVKLFWINK